METEKYRLVKKDNLYHIYLTEFNVCIAHFVRGVGESEAESIVNGANDIK